MTTKRTFLITFLLYYVNIVSARKQKIHFTHFLKNSIVDDVMKSHKPRHNCKPEAFSLSIVTSLPTSPDEPLPDRKDLDPRRLKRILGRKYDAKYLSVRRPASYESRPNGTDVFTLPAQLPRVGPFSFDPPRRLRGRGLHISIKDPRMRRKIRRFLAVYTLCPVHFRWRDGGPRMWPRWLREGACATEHSCSIPPGLHCEESGRTELTRLVWHCKRRKGCRWWPYKFDITTACSCGCKKFQN